MELTMNPLVKYLNKTPQEFQREDLVNFIAHHGINQVNFHYEGIDGKLRELKFPVQNKKYLELILAEGERVDGSSLFKHIFEAGASDLYVIPVYKSAFVNPFSPNTLDIFCRFFDKTGKLADRVPANILWRADSYFQEKTGMQLYALGELEFYLLFDKEDPRFPAVAQQGYHQSSPFVRGMHIVDQILTKVSEITNHVKYCHSEVGYIDRMESDLEELNNKRLEQYELEFTLAPLVDMNYYMTMSKWIIRNIAWQNNVSVSFAPKLMEGMAGNGMHIHMAPFKDGKNCLMESDGSYGDTFYKVVGGLIEHAKDMVGFGNTVASSFLRLVPNQEAPTKICWSDINRSTLVRVPLGWHNTGDMCKIVNPNQEQGFPSGEHHPTVELRNPDSSAYLNLLLASIALSTADGLTKEESIDLAKKTYVQGDIFKNEALLAKLDSLPANCYETAGILKEKRSFFEKDGIFPEAILDYVISHLEQQEDQFVHEHLKDYSAIDRADQINKLLQRDLHYR